MQKLLLTLQGFRKIDEIRAIWNVSHKNVEGKEIKQALYSIYEIYYNTKKDTYFIKRGGFFPYNHSMNAELVSIVEMLNNKGLEKDLYKYSLTPEDYFFQKDLLFSLINGRVTPIETFNSSEDGVDLVVLRFGLEESREYVFSFRSNDPIKKEALKGFMKSEYFDKGAEIYEDVDNIIITDEGYYICINKSDLNKLKDEDTEE